MNTGFRLALQAWLLYNVYQQRWWALTGFCIYTCVLNESRAYVLTRCVEASQSACRILLRMEKAHD